MGIPESEPERCRNRTPRGIRLRHFGKLIREAAIKQNQHETTDQTNWRWFGRLADCFVYLVALPSLLLHEPRRSLSIDRWSLPGRPATRGATTYLTHPVLRSKELQKMRTSNAEWDLMGRSFLCGRWPIWDCVIRSPHRRISKQRIESLMKPCGWRRKTACTSS